jgi:hypothetical protein
LKDKKIGKVLWHWLTNSQNGCWSKKGETMSEIKQNENEPPEHFELRYLLQEAKAIVLPMSPDQRKKWVAESRIAQEIYAILVQHPPSFTRSFDPLLADFFPNQ